MYRYIGSYYGRETVNEEFKVFCINSSTWQKHFEHEEVQKLYHDRSYFIDRRRFDQMIKVELEGYFDRYFSKYIACFVSSNIKGTLHIGLSDSGIIEGIPFFENITDIPFHTFMEKCFRNTLRIKSSYYDIDLDYIMNHISINISKLEQFELLDDTNDSAVQRLQNNLSTREECKKKWNEYKEKYKEWHDELFTHNVKLRELINMPTIQRSIANFIRSQVDNYSCDLSSMITYYESSPIIDYDITMQIVADSANDFLNPIYWLISYKDYKVNEIQKRKPVAPIQQPSDFNYMHFAQHMVNIRPYLLKQSCNFYTVTITVKQIENCVLEYLDVKGEWQTKKRIMANETIGPITTEA